MSEIDTETVTDIVIYSHPKLEQLTLDQLRLRLDAIRNRRLIAAINFKTTAEQRISVYNSKVGDQRDRLVLKTQRDIDAVDEKIAKIEEAISKIISLDNQLKVTL